MHDTEQESVEEISDVETFFERRSANCYFCKAHFREPSPWRPDRNFKQSAIRRDHCSLLCYRRWVLLHRASPKLRLEDALCKVRERISSCTATNVLAELKTREAFYLKGLQRYDQQ